MSEASRVVDEQEIRISADSHMAEPFDLWEKRLPEELRERGQHYPKARYGAGLHLRPGGWDPAARLKDMAADGISADVLYPTLGKDMYRQGKHPDPELTEASARAYNDWMIEFCQEAPDRLWGQAEICLWDMDRAIDEMQRTKRAGLKGATIWMVPPDGLPFTSDHYERFWAAAQDLAMPVSMHINQGFGPYGADRDSLRGGIVESVSFTCGGHKAIAMQVLTEIICSGVLERYPRVKVVVAELEVGWIPFWLEDVDRRFLKSREHTRFPLLPSEYFKRQIYATFTQDEVGGYLLQRWGADNFLWSNDYPHPGCIWPYSDEVIALTLSHLGPATRAKVLYQNVAQLYGMPVPAPMPRQPLTDPETVWERPWIHRE